MVDAILTLFELSLGVGYIGMTYRYSRAFLSRYHPSTWFGYVSCAFIALGWPVLYVMGALLAFFGATPKGLLASPFSGSVEVWDEKRRCWVSVTGRNARIARERTAQAEYLAAFQAKARAEDDERRRAEERDQEVFDEWQSRTDFWLQQLSEAERLPEGDLRREAALHVAQENLDFLEETKPRNPFVERTRKAVQLDESSAATPVGSANPATSSGFDDRCGACGEEVEEDDCSVCRTWHRRAAESDPFTDAGRAMRKQILNHYALPPSRLVDPGRLHQQKRMVPSLYDDDFSSNRRSLTFGGSVGPCATCGTNRFLINNLCPGCTQNLRKVQERAATAKVVPFDEDDEQEF